MKRYQVAIGSVTLAAVLGWFVASRMSTDGAREILFASTATQPQLPPETSVNLREYLRPSPSFRSFAHSPGVEYDAASGNYRMTIQFRQGGNSTLEWEPPTKLDAVVTASVQFLSDREVYEYRYRVTNRRDSTQNLWTFGVFIGGASVEEVVSPRNWTHQTTVVYEAQRIPFVLWTTTAMADEVEGGPGLIPGQSAEFSIMSPNPPGQALCYSAGWALPPRVPDDWGAIKDPPGAPAVLMAGLAGVTITPADGVSQGGAAMVDATRLFVQAGWAAVWDDQSMTFTATRAHDTAEDRLFYGAPPLAVDGKLRDHFILQPNSPIGIYNGEPILMFRPAQLDSEGNLLVPFAVLDWIAIQGEETLLKNR